MLSAQPPCFLPLLLPPLLVRTGFIMIFFFFFSLLQIWRKDV